MTQINNTLIPSQAMFEFDKSSHGLKVTSLCHKNTGPLFGLNRHPIHKAVTDEFDDNLVYGCWNNVKKWFRRRT